MYTIDQYLAHKLRNACRRLTGGCFAMTPLNDFLLFKEFICVIKEQIRKCLHLMPEIRQEYFLNPPLLPDVVLLPHELPPAPQSDLTIQTKNIALFQCPSCPSRFECENLLNSHATFHEQHAKEKFICFVCETIFTWYKFMLGTQFVGWKINLLFYYFSSAALKKHATSKKHQTNMKYVKSNNSYTCGTCGKCITLLQNLRTHELHHLGVNFKRRFCSETFRTRNKVRKHETENHGSLPRYVCSSCAEQFIKYKDFSAHVKTHTATNSKEVIKATRNKPIITSGESINDLVPASGQDKSCAQPGGKKPNSKSKSIVLWTTPLHITPNIKASGLSRKCAVKPLHQNNVRKPDKK